MLIVGHSVQVAIRTRQSTRMRPHVTAPRTFSPVPPSRLSFHSSCPPLLKPRPAPPPSPYPPGLLRQCPGRSPLPSWRVKPSYQQQLGRRKQADSCHLQLLSCGCGPVSITDGRQPEGGSRPEAVMTSSSLGNSPDNFSIP